jgi:hypothetical protein
MRAAESILQVPDGKQPEGAINSPLIEARLRSGRMAMQRDDLCGLQLFPMFMAT